MPARTRRVVAADWSGDLRAESTPHPKLWIAEAIDGELVSLDPSSRRGVVDRLLGLAAADPQLLIGLDLCFSFPSWFVHEQGCRTGPDLWPHVGDLDTRTPPFFGSKGSRRPAPERLFRACEEEARSCGFAPSSVFQVNGPGSVGTGSLRGMPHLATLRAEGFAIWPWDPVEDDRPVVVEAYPRAFARAVVKTRAAERAAHVATLALPGDLAAKATASDDAFDAAVTALGLTPWADGTRTFEAPPAPAEVVAAEGWVLGF